VGCRVELFPFDYAASRLKALPKGVQLVWAQEEPRNMGAWAYVAPRIATAARDIGREVKPGYADRAAAAFPATGSGKVHDQEVASLLKDTFA
jgi:2-oxoglutarate dehydrogenase E1 component